MVAAPPPRLGGFGLGEPHAVRLHPLALGHRTPTRPVLHLPNLFRAPRWQPTDRGSWPVAPTVLMYSPRPELPQRTVRGQDRRGARARRSSHLAIPPTPGTLRTTAPRRKRSRACYLRPPHRARVAQRSSFCVRTPHRINLRKYRASSGVILAHWPRRPDYFPSRPSVDCIQDRCNTHHPARIAWGAQAYELVDSFSATCERLVALDKETR